MNIQSTATDIDVRSNSYKHPCIDVGSNSTTLPRSAPAATYTYLAAGQYIHRLPQSYMNLTFLHSGVMVNIVKESMP